MRIGLRTIKTVIAAVLAILLANFFGLTAPTTAGIIAILSVTNTKKSSFKVGFGRIVALLGALLIAYGCYSLLGYNAFAFGLFLLIYIPLAARFKVAEAIPVNSVLITHFLMAQSMSLDLVLNAIYLLLIGVGLALVANLYMPNVEKEIKTNQQVVDETIQFILMKLSRSLSQSATFEECDVLLEGLSKSIKQGTVYARNHQENRLLTSSGYHFEYFQMRRMQLSVLESMTRLIREIDVDSDVAKEVSTLLATISKEYGEKNDAQALKEQVEQVYNVYVGKPLPATRSEFENRARLYQLLNDIQLFIDIKVNFSNNDSR
ncbi:hypothetical protein CBF34_03365 [Vagococcus penaei]|uniref:Uncharacterized protein n=1 Tax=Vagococcus penaei TaxID=633807 RepID=A0A1Q2D7D6_9ENTE|nr:aromatic acid exporter family protein [Vagococcus penaei]AQP54304.1 hypothetical protein BW732_08770 [Vagococcus penaei]RSU05809.1 hypothetical protein CBF34_03365 [Vagococcus penaei]